MIQKRHLCMSLMCATLLGLTGCGESLDSRPSDLIQYEPKIKLGKDREAGYSTGHQRKSVKKDADKPAEEAVGEGAKKSDQ